MRLRRASMALVRCGLVLGFGLAIAGSATAQDGGGGEGCGPQGAGNTVCVAFSGAPTICSGAGGAGGSVRCVGCDTTTMAGSCQGTCNGSAMGALCTDPSREKAVCDCVAGVISVSGCVPADEECGHKAPTLGSPGALLLGLGMVAASVYILPLSRRRRTA